MPLPASLYKYEPFSLQTVLNLKRQVIHFGSPLNFNDPYDCALPPAIETPSEQDVEVVRQMYLRKPDLPAQARIEFETHDYPRLCDLLVRAARGALENMVQEFLRTRGVACFSEKNDDLLMWSHYGGHYKGFCLEFSTTSEPFHKCQEVRYVATLPRVSVRSILMDHDFHPVQDLFCTKSEAWSYEREWRAMHYVASTQFCYPPEALTGIYFGPDIDQPSLEIACLVLAGQNEHVRFWAGKRSLTEFRVHFEPFTYTSHLDAKRSGKIT